MKRLLSLLLSPAVIGTLGLLALSALIWWVGPLLAVGDSRPLAGLVTRIVVLLLLWLGWIGRLVWVAYKRRRTNAALLAGLSGGASATDKEAQVLAQRFNDALGRLKAARGGRWWGGGQYLYELPWYIFVGAPGSGKTTALMNAGLQFLLGDGADKASVQGVGGTRNCEWWFTADAVLVDTAGRYATQDSDRGVDASAWDRFLALLKSARPRQPVNGVLLTVNVQDLLQQGGTERDEHAGKLRARLQELQTKLGVQAPVYVLVTKADLISGFNETFENLSKEERDQVWGFTFDAAAADPLQDFATRTQELQRRIADQLLDRLEAERDVMKRAAMFSFPQEFAALQPVLGDFLRKVFSGGGAIEKAPPLRGVYFTSGTQEGSPIDRVMGAIGRSFGIEGRAAAATDGRGRSYFLHRLLRDVVFAERGLGTVDPAAERRRQLLRAGAFATMAVFATALLSGWAVSRSRNLAQAQVVAARLPAIEQAVAALPPASNVDVVPLALTLAQVRDAARNERFEVAAPPLLDALGLYQGDKLDAGARLAYQRLLEKALMPRVARRLEERLRAASKDNLENAYEALKTYLMLHNAEQFDAAVLKAWITLDWDANLGSTLTEAQRGELVRHLDAALALGPPQAALPLDQALVGGVREMLATYPLEYRIYSRIKRQVRPGDVPDFSVARAGGPAAAQVFERLSGQPLTQGVPGLYTREGYRKLLLPAVGPATLRLAGEEHWVMGVKADPARLRDAALGGPLVDRVRRLYFEDYIKTWDRYLADVRLVKLGGLESSIAVSRIVSAVDSPLAAYMRGVAEETTLVPPPTAANPLAQAAEKAKADAARLAGAGPAATGGSGPLERMVDDHFAAVRRQVQGQPAPIDATLKLFGEIYVQLTALEAAQKSKSPPPPGGGDKIKAAAGQQPEPIRSMLEQLADAGASQSRSVERAGLSGELKPVTDFCNRAIAGRYPFAAGSRADVLPEDFGQFFGGGGLMDDFFQRRLGPLVDTSTANWSFKPLADGTRPPAPAALADFQRAQRIREVFFRGGGQAPAVKLELRALELQDGLGALTLDIDGQKFELAPGKPSVAVAWPSARIATQITLSGGGTALPPSEGPWALFRLFDRFELQPGSQAERFIVVMNIGGKRARVEVVAGSVFNPLRLREVQQFRCPGSL